jgi:hypothetical protein
MKYVSLALALLPSLAHAAAGECADAARAAAAAHVRHQPYFVHFDPRQPNRAVIRAVRSSFEGGTYYVEVQFGLPSPSRDVLTAACTLEARDSDCFVSQQEVSCDVQ